jgi:hypothetical protein
VTASLAKHIRIYAKGRTRLTVIELKQGEWTDECTDIKGALEQWVVEELGGIAWPL